MTFSDRAHSSFVLKMLSMAEMTFKTIKGRLAEALWIALTEAITKYIRSYIVEPRSRRKQSLVTVRPRLRPRRPTPHDLWPWCRPPGRSCAQRRPAPSLPRGPGSNSARRRRDHSGSASTRRLPLGIPAAPPSRCATCMGGWGVDTRGQKENKQV